MILRRSPGPGKLRVTGDAPHAIRMHPLFMRYALGLILFLAAATTAYPCRNATELRESKARRQPEINLDKFQDYSRQKDVDARLRSLRYAREEALPRRVNASVIQLSETVNSSPSTSIR